MSKVWEFAVTPARCAIIAGCLAGAGVMIGSAGFAAGLLLAPRFVTLNAEPSKAGETKKALAELTPPKMPPAPEISVPAVANAEPPAPSPAPQPKPAATPPVAAKPPAPAKAAEPVSAKVEPGQAAPKTEKPPVQLAVQVGSFSSQENAENTVERLKRSGYPAFAFSRTDASSHQWHVVQVGPYYAYAAAAKTVLELANTYRLAPVIISSRSF